MQLEAFLPTTTEQFHPITAFGQTIQARGLTGLEQAFIDGAFPRPDPPLKPKPGKGSLSTDQEPDYDDPAFRILSEAWLARHQLAMIVLATENLRRTTLDMAAADWIKARVAKLVDMDKAVRLELYNGIRRLGLPTLPETLEESEKNFSRTPVEAAGPAGA